MDKLRKGLFLDLEIMTDHTTHIHIKLFDMYVRSNV